MTTFLVGLIPFAALVFGPTYIGWRVNRFEDSQKSPKYWADFGENCAFGWVTLVVFVAAPLTVMYGAGWLARFVFDF